MASITPYAGARFQKGHGLGSVFKSLARMAIPLLKGPVMRAGVGLAGDMIRGRSMSQALRNRVRPLVGDVLHTASSRLAGSSAGNGRRAPRKRRTTATKRAGTAAKRRRRAPAASKDIFTP